MTVNLNKNRVIKYVVALNLFLLLMLSNFCFATSTVNDVTPPVGRIRITGATMVNNVNYVERAQVQVEVYAVDDICPESDIKYYISTSEISDASEITTWYDYATEGTKTITLPNTSSLNTIYAVFKDSNGNTSKIYKNDNMKFDVVYDANGGTEAPEGVTSYYGMSLVATNQAPKRDGYYFCGWSTTQNATSPSYYPGEVIPANVFVGGPKTITLYAVWSQTINDLPDLADVVKIGDYVNYPVYYDNVNTFNNSYKSTLDGWRVISKDVDLDGQPSEGTVNLVSAGVPLTYYHGTAGDTLVTALTTNFLTTSFTLSDKNTYRKKGFLAYESLINTFTNKYTEMKEDGITPRVRAMIKEDILRATGLTEMKAGSEMALADAKYQTLFANRCYYWLASVRISSGVWCVFFDGNAGAASSKEYGIRPVVSLKSTVKATGTDMVSAWNIEI